MIEEDTIITTIKHSAFDNETRRNIYVCLAKEVMIQTSPILIRNPTPSDNVRVMVFARGIK